MEESCYSKCRLSSTEKKSFLGILSVGGLLFFGGFLDYQNYMVYTSTI